MSLFINYRDRRGDRRPSDAVEGPALEDGGRQLRDELALVGVVRDVEVEKARVGDGQRRRPRLRADLDLEARRRREARGARREDEEATERVLVEGADAPPERVASLSASRSGAVVCNSQNAGTTHCAAASVT